MFWVPGERLNSMTLNPRNLPHTPPQTYRFMYQCPTKFNPQNGEIQPDYYARILRAKYSVFTKTVTVSFMGRYVQGHSSCKHFKNVSLDTWFQWLRKYGTTMETYVRGKDKNGKRR